MSLMKGRCARGVGATPEEIAGVQSTREAQPPRRENGEAQSNQAFSAPNASMRQAGRARSEFYFCCLNLLRIKICVYSPATSPAGVKAANVIASKNSTKPAPPS